ncbi:MAG: hypothetical protein IID44_09900 [Planctomycetes bacterium]|nr:hypothetical protein [Planctomycetota bacterium]
MKALLAHGIALLFAAGAVMAQAQVIVVSPNTAAAPAGVAKQKGDDASEDPAASKAAAAKEAEAAAEAKQQARVQKIKQLQFDRRPSAILKAWSTPAGGGEDSADPADPEDPDAKPKDEFDLALERFVRHVTLGRWSEVKSYLASLPADEGQALYQHLLESFASSASAAPVPAGAGIDPAQLARMQATRVQQQGRIPQRHSFSFDDMLALAAAAPAKLTDERLESLAKITKLAIDNGHVVDRLVALLKQEVAKAKGNSVLDTRQAAKLLLAANQPIPAGEFLPTIQRAQQEKDHEALNLLSQHYMAVFAEKKKVEFLEKAWQVTQAVLLDDEIDKKQKESALKQAVELAPQIHHELGQDWLEESFTKRPERGMEIIATIGAAAASGLERLGTDSSARLKGLQLQTSAVEALLKASPERADKWRASLSILAENWLREADVSYRYDTSTSLGPNAQRDVYGNIFYMQMMQAQAQQAARGLQAIATGELLEIRPSDAWLARVSASVRPSLHKAFARLYLKVHEEDRALPYIEQLAASHPQIGKELVDEFLRVWTTNHDPNSTSRRQNRYMYIYGFEQRAAGIPLTRSKQQRNLKELAGLIVRLRALPVELDEELLAKAFTTCHSSAEVYRLDSIEKVFGSLDDLDPRTLAELVQQMRANLVGLWRVPAVQKQNKTKRKQRDIQAEVFRGYQVARSVVAGALKKHPNHWALHLARAAIEHDENNYRKEIKADSGFSKRHGDAFASFQNAARLYAAQVGDIDENEESTKVFDLWFYASLGACDLANINEQTVPDLRQPARIRKAILAMKGEAAERHMTKFANALFTRMSAAKPAIKFRYVRAGLEIVGDHKRAREARKVYDYYKDLVTEIRLEAKIDGSDVVGHNQPFGLFVNLRHTREIERESGGFGRYLQNQNAGNRYYYNYGRPLEDYRDKFEEVVRQAFGEHFEVLSVTFESETVNSRALPEYGWRVTPYAYVLLKARGAEVDKLPSLRLDLDFIDTSGYAILPIESPAVPIDASSEKGDPRPLQNLSIVQTLDERQADEGKLIVEIKATGHGLIPDLDEILKLNNEPFEIVEIDDQGVSVSRFDPDTEQSLVVTERTWLVTFRAAEGLDELPTTFEFGSPLVEVKEAIYQRYEDADLAQVESTVVLGERYGAASRAWVWLLAAVAVVGFGLVAFLLLRPRREPVQERCKYQLPESITPFTVLGLLRQIQHTNGLDQRGHEELATTIDRLEHSYFNEERQATVDLREIADTWVTRAK